jgi:ABC-type sugar transport system ATPase subunit
MNQYPPELDSDDRILVIHEGKIRAELSREDATQEIIMSYATGMVDN